jgi:hypothetical protein
LQAFPVAFMEFIEDEHGNKRREGPHDEKTERKLEDAWKVTIITAMTYTYSESPASETKD